MCLVTTILTCPDLTQANIQRKPLLIWPNNFTWLFVLGCALGIPLHWLVFSTGNTWGAWAATPPKSFATRGSGSGEADTERAAPKKRLQDAVKCRSRIQSGRFPTSSNFQFLGGRMFSRCTELQAIELESAALWQESLHWQACGEKHQDAQSHGCGRRCHLI